MAGRGKKAARTSDSMRLESTNLRGGEGEGGDQKGEEIPGAENMYALNTQNVRKRCRGDLLLHLIVEADPAELRTYVRGIMDTLIIPIFGPLPRLAIIDKIASGEAPGDAVIPMLAIIFFARYKHCGFVDFFVPPRDENPGVAPKVDPYRMQDFRGRILPAAFKALLSGKDGHTHLDKTVSDLIGSWISM